MRRIYLLISFVLITLNLFGQDSIKKNSIMVETNGIMMTSLSYDRYVHFNEKAAIIFGGEYIMGTGFGWGAHWLVPEVGILAFGPKHFLETGIQYAFDISEYNEDVEIYGREHSFGVRLAYRYQTNAGFNVRVTANGYFTVDPIFIPTLGIGYSF